MIYDDEKRKQERYQLELPVNIRGCEGFDYSSDKMFTRDISSQGVFISSNSLRIKDGSRVHLEMVLSIDKLKELFGYSKYIVLKVSGSIVRSKEEGIVVEFDKNYSIFPEQLLAT